MISPGITLAHVRAALALPSFDVEAAWAPLHVRPLIPRVAPPGRTARPAAVLILLYPLAESLTTVLIQRTPDPGVHSGQIAFPGGAVEPGDADSVAAALREACEEIGVCQEPVSILGQLAPVYIPPSNFLVTPVVGALPWRPAFTPGPEEVAALLEMPLDALLDPARKKETRMHLRGIDLEVPYYDVEGQIVWGATALMLAELEARLRRVLAAPHAFSSIL